MTQDFSTKAIHAGYDRRANADAAVVPIYATAAFDLENAVRGDALAAGDLEGFTYSRVANPTVDVLERRLAALEGGVGAVVFASGMAAISSALLNAAEGGRIISPANLYGASVDAMKSFFPRFGVHTDFVRNVNDLAEVESVIKPNTKAIYAESVANPTTEITDVEPLAELAHRHHIPLIIDNTIPTPYLFRPIEFGADIVVHSTTKGIGGHGNAIGGAVIDAGRFDWANGRFPQFTDQELVISDERKGIRHSFVSRFGSKAFISRIRIEYLRTFGAAQSPFNAYLTLAGLATLPEREARETATAAIVAEHLTHVPHVLKVNYASLGTNAQRDLVNKYYPQGVGAVLSFLVEGTRDNVRRILNETRVFTYIPNIGDVQSLIVDPGPIINREVSVQTLRENGVTDNLIRLSIGLEDADDLIADLDQAIAAAY